MSATLPPDITALLVQSILAAGEGVVQPPAFATHTDPGSLAAGEDPNISLEGMLRSIYYDVQFLKMQAEMNSLKPNHTAVSGFGVGADPTAIIAN